MALVSGGEEGFVCVLATTRPNQTVQKSETQIKMMGSVGGWEPSLSRHTRAHLLTDYPSLLTLSPMGFLLFYALFQLYPGEALLIFRWWSRRSCRWNCLCLFFFWVLPIYILFNVF